MCSLHFFQMIARALFVLAVCLAPVQGQSQEQKPQDDQQAVGSNTPSSEWIVEKTGRYLPLETKFVDEHAVEVTLGSLIDKPTLLLPVYFYCPSSCSKNLANMAVAMNRMSFEPGRDYRAIALSFSETETPVNASRAKQNYLKLLYDGFPADEWKFLTGDAESIRAVLDAMGYRVKKLPDGTYIHPSAVIAVGTDGKIIRYVYGSFIPGDMDMAIESARQGRPALSVKRLLQFCFNYDPAANKPIFFYVKIGVVIFFAIGVALIFYFSRKRKSS